MSSLQGLVTTAEERLKSREADLSKAIREHKVAATRSKNQMQEHGGSVAYLAEKARMTQSKHAENLEHARSERSCQPDIERLTAEIQSLAKWKREAIHNGCRISPSPRRSLAGADE